MSTSSQPQPQPQSQTQTQPQPQTQLQPLTQPATLPPQQAQVPPVSATQRTAEARTAFTASLRSAAAHLDVDLQSRAKNIHANAQALQKQERDVQRETRGLGKVNDELERELGRWKGELEGFANKGKGKGKGKGREVDEWDLEGIEKELGVLDEWVRIVEGEGVEEERGGTHGEEGEEGWKRKEEGGGGEGSK